MNNFPYFWDQMSFQDNFIFNLDQFIWPKFNYQLKERSLTF